MSWLRRSERGVSKSMIAFTLAVLGVLALAIQTFVPGLIGKDSGVHVTNPSLLTVADSATGIATLAGGHSVSLYASGLRITDTSGDLLLTVIKGSPISAVIGTVTGSGGRRVEHPETIVSNVRIDAVATTANRARYTGIVYDATHEMPLTIDVTSEGTDVSLAARVPGASALVWHLTSDYEVTGYTPGLDGRNLRRRAWWLGPLGERTTFTSQRGADLTVRPTDVVRALDLRETGRIDVHVWSERSSLLLMRRAAPPDRSAS
ncbi:hypothetical protein [Nostocoides vanveenii]|uniref:Uncharacterized protein n=1 Tax=Nostocoides vanveenii TaxID=330835 RepID=A0ABP4X4U1_9MICO